MRLGDPGVFGTHGRDIGRLLLARQKRGDDAHRPARVIDVDRLAARIIRMDLHRRVHAARGRAADQQRNVEALALHLGGDEAHLVERGRDQPGEADEIGLLLARRVEDLPRRHHDAEVDHLVVVALEHDADDVLADVVHIALDGRHHDAARGRARGKPARPLLLFHEGQEIGDRLLHHASRFHHLRQEHLAGAEEVADHVHAGHQRAFDDVERTLGRKPRLLGVGLDEIGDAVDERVLEPLVDRPLRARTRSFSVAALPLPRKRSASARSRSVGLAPALRAAG